MSFHSYVCYGAKLQTLVFLKWFEIASDLIGMRLTFESLKTFNLNSHQEAVCYINELATSHFDLLT